MLVGQLISDLSKKKSQENEKQKHVNLDSLTHSPREISLPGSKDLRGGRKKFKGMREMHKYARNFGKQRIF